MWSTYIGILWLMSRLTYSNKVLQKVIKFVYFNIRFHICLLTLTFLKNKLRIFHTMMNDLKTKNKTNIFGYMESLTKQT